MSREKRSTCVKCGTKKSQSKMKIYNSMFCNSSWNKKWFKYPKNSSWICLETCKAYIW